MGLSYTPHVSLEIALPNTVQAPVSLSWAIWQTHNPTASDAGTADCLYHKASCFETDSTPSPSQF